MEKLLFRQPGKRRSRLEMFAEIAEHFVKALYLVLERRQGFGTIFTADEKCSSVSEHARHMSDQLFRRANIIAGSEFRETIRSTSQRLLRPVRKRRQKVSKHVTFVIHLVEHTTVELRNSDFGLRIC